MKTKYVEPNAYMSKEMKRAFDAAVKKQGKATESKPKAQKAAKSKKK